MAEPPQARRGEVARAYLYMDATYPDALSLSPLERRRLGKWAAEDPPDEFERARAKAIGAMQGVPHPWLGDDAAEPEASPAEDTTAEPEAPPAEDTTAEDAKVD